MIKLENIHKFYNNGKQNFHALRNIHLSIASGEIFGIMGLSGAGKSTLLRCINLLEKPEAGDITIDGINISKLSSKKLRKMRRQIGMIFQHFNLLSSRTVYENIAFPLEIAHLDKKIIREKVLAISTLTGLENKLHHYPDELSGGQKQRVAIARALVAGSKILLCDEATSSLDPETTQSILDLLKKLRNELNITIVLITHEMHVIKNICDRVALIENGEIIEEGETSEIFANPKTDTAKRFVFSTLHIHLPEYLKNKIRAETTPNSLTVLRLWFLKESAKEAVIAYVIKQFDVNVNILQASLEYIHEHLMGIMIISIEAYGDTLKNCIAYLAEHNIKVEVIGYV